MPRQERSRLSMNACSMANSNCGWWWRRGRCRFVHLANIDGRVGTEQAGSWVWTHCSQVAVVVSREGAEILRMKRMLPARAVAWNSIGTAPQTAAYAAVGPDSPGLRCQRPKGIFRPCSRRVAFGSPGHCSKSSTRPQINAILRAVRRPLSDGVTERGLFSPPFPALTTR